MKMLSYIVVKEKRDICYFNLENKTNVFSAY